MFAADQGHMTDEYGIPSQGVLLEQIAAQLHEMRTDPEARIVISCSGLQASLNAVGWIYEADSEKKVLLPSQLFRLLLDLRHASYVQNRGTWFSAKLTLNEQGKLSADFDYKDEPRILDESYSDAEYAEEQARFPRAAQYQPEWLQRFLITG